MNKFSRVKGEQILKGDVFLCFFFLQAIFSLSQWTLKKKPFERLIFPTKYVIPKRLKFSHWPSKYFMGVSNFHRIEVEMIF